MWNHEKILQSGSVALFGAWPQLVLFSEMLCVFVFCLTQIELAFYLDKVFLIKNWASLEG
jgi:hypothetical protein